MSTTMTPRYSAADLLQMPDGDHYELVDGELVETDMGGKSSWVGLEVAARLREFARKRRGSFVFPEGAGYRCFPDNPEKVRRPDASFIDTGRLPGAVPPEGYILVPPDLAVEVISPNDSYYHVEKKVDEYLEAGVRMVWIVNPDNRTVRVVTRGQKEIVQLGPDDELTGGDVLPGFSCRVAEFFPTQSA